MALHGDVFGYHSSEILNRVIQNIKELEMSSGLIDQRPCVFDALLEGLGGIVSKCHTGGHEEIIIDLPVSTCCCPGRSSHASCNADPATKSRQMLFGSSCMSTSGM